MQIRTGFFYAPCVAHRSPSAHCGLSHKINLGITVDVFDLSHYTTDIATAQAEAQHGKTETMTNFADMLNIERAQCQAWARAHDWGRTALFEGAGDAPGPFLMFNIHPDDQDDEYAGGHIKPHIIRNGRIGFRNMKGLRDWAGY